MIKNEILVFYDLRPAIPKRYLSGSCCLFEQVLFPFLFQDTKSGCCKDEAVKGCQSYLIPAFCP